MNDYAFGNFLTQLRSEKGLSQVEVGKRLGVTNKAVSKWENGAAKPNTALLPAIASLYEVTVEELFAAKRIREDEESLRVKSFLARQKKRLAILASFWGAILWILPALLVEFICFVMIFVHQKDVVGPLGAVGLILLFIVATVSFSIHATAYRRTPMPSIPLYSDRTPGRMRRALLAVAILLWFIVILLSPILFWVLDKSGNARATLALLFAAILTAILLFGTFSFLLGLRRRLGIKLTTLLHTPDRETGDAPTREKWKDQPLWVKLCLIFATLTLPILSGLYIISGYEATPVGILSILYWSAILAVSIYRIIKRRQQ